MFNNAVFNEKTKLPYAACVSVTLLLQTVHLH
jgi:hypothetical protein